MQLQSVLELFHQIVEQHGSKPALCSSEEEVSYRDLEQRANRLSQFLLHHGGRQNHLVAILLDNRVALVTTILATLKAAYVFVSLDPKTPLKRLSAMMAEIEPQWIITEPKFFASVQQLATECALSSQILCVTDEHDPLVEPQGLSTLTREYLAFQESTRPLTPPLDPDGLCYIYFTSGSTGKPKGIAGRRKGLDHFIRWELKTINAEPGIRVSQLISPSFDAILRDIFVPLCSGGVVCIPNGRNTLLDAERLVQWLEAERINVIHCTPSLFRTMINTRVSAECLMALRYILLSGERLLPADVSRWTAVFGNRIQLINLYGPTETTMTKLCYFVQPEDAERRSIPIGKPMEGVRVLLIDEMGRACPDGTVGEIYIRTPYRSLGYYRQPELTAQVFVQNPFSQRADDIIYKTGDYGRLLPDGNLEYLGRRDQQVKIRGLRIELGEIENILRSHPLVEDVAVVDREANQGSNQLYAYLVMTQKLEPDALYSFLQQHLPEGMFPSAFIYMEALPRTLSGKIDRRALPDPELVRPDLAAEYLGPRTPLEEVLVHIWSQVLNIERIGIHDNFFLLGGYSLLVTQVIARVRDMLQAEIPLQTFFEHPTIAQLSAYLDTIETAGAKPKAPPLRQIERTGNLPLSFAQQRLWFLYQWEPTNPYYNMVGAVRLVGKLDHAALERSFATIVERHESLRTTFDMLDAHPIQVISPVLSLSFPVVDLSALHPSQREAQIQRLTEQENLLPFNLSQGPLLRTTLLHVDTQDHVLLLTIHHIVFDGWSLGVLIDEFATLYRAYSQGLPSLLPPLPIQYADYAVWQREWLQGDALETQVSYWSKQLEDVPALLELPLDHPRPTFQRFRGDKYYFNLSAEVTQNLKALCQREGVTLFMALLAVFQVLLARYSRQRDIVVGTAIANRTRTEIEGLLGFFVNTLLMRTRLDGNPTFLELLSQVRKMTLEAYAHQDLPFEYLVEVLRPERNLSYAPLFQVSFVLQNAPVQSLDLPGLTLHSLQTATHTAKNDLALYMYEADDRLGADLEYNTDLFEGATIVRMAQHLQNLLAEVLASPDRAVMALPFLSLQERQQLLMQWNTTQVSYLPGATLPELFEAQVLQTPEAIALVFDEYCLTYDELNRKANQLARHLQTLGIGPDVLVGLCLERSLEMIIGLIAVLKAGGAYVPLDTEYPQERLAFLLADTQIALLLTQENLRERFPETTIPVLSFESLQVTLFNQSCANVASKLTNQHLAYVIYTSGSTGKPKGVMITHQGICNHMFWVQEAFAFNATDRMLQKTAFSFDASVWEIFAPLLSGGCLVMAQPGGQRDSQYLIEVLVQQQITLLQMVPSLLQVLVMEEELADCQYLRHVFCGGETLSIDLQRRFSECLSAALHNLYGPTEACIDATFWNCECLDDRIFVPIGCPLPNIEIYLLDEWLQPVPIGVAGEIYIAGVGLARGYHRRADLTAERFLPHPFSQEVGARMYRTGDLAHYLPNGAIEFIGRVDEQIKLRGYRIEPGEIEASLRSSSLIRDVVVQTHEDASGDRQLVAYVVAQSPSHLSSDHLQAKQVEQVKHWQMLYEEIYTQSSESIDPMFNVIGWNSSYTGLPLPAEHMHEWVEQTISQLQALRPQHVLEIGCGTGLLLLRLAPHCQRYVGTDFSRSVLTELQAQVHQRGLHNVELREQRADQLEDWPSASFDLVLLNSVVQYFPSLDYLQQVLSQAMRLLRPGGVIFVGDVRHLPLLETFHTSVELAQARASLSVGQLRQRIVQRRENEEELVVAPAFFYHFAETYPQMRQVKVCLKRGQHHNELTCYRYDILLQIDDEAPQKEALSPSWVDWHEQGMTMETLRQCLIKEQPEMFGLKHIPNARLQEDLLACQMVGQAEETMTVGNLRTILQPQRAQLIGKGVHPEEFWQLADGLGYVIEMNWANGRSDGSYEVLLRRPGPVDRIQFPVGEMKSRARDALANTPLAGMLRHKWIADLRSYLQNLLPEYMVPSIFIPLEYLPVTPSGKLDRQALPSPGKERPKGVGRYEAPLTLVEELLAGLWSEVLGLENVGRHDNFFDLGGHSLLATQLVSRIRVTFQVELSLRQFFASPTVAGLAEQLEKAQQDTQVLQTPPLLPVSRATPLPLSFAQQRLWFIDQLNPGNTAYLMSNIWQLSGRLDTAALINSLKALVQRHESLRTTFHISEQIISLVQVGQPVQVIAPIGELIVPLIDLCGLPLEERENSMQLLAFQEAQRPCNLSQGPLLRVYLLRLEKQEHVLFLTLHHIISDGWSMQVMQRNLTALYRAFSSGQPSPLPPLPIQYADFSTWQRQWLQGEALEAQLVYWWKRLAGAPELKLPRDYPRPAIQSFKGASHRFALQKELSHKLTALSRREGVTLFMLLLAAFQVLLYRYSGQEDLVLGTDSANRNRTETEGIIGFFINLLVLRTDLSGKPSLREVLHRVRETVLGAYMHQETPFELLVEKLAPSHTLESTPLIQALFVLQNLPPLQEQEGTGDGGSQDINGLTVTSRSLGGQVKTVKFDLAVFLREQAGQLYGTVDYNVDLFKATTIATMMARFEVLLRNIVQQPDISIDLLDFLTPAEQTQVESVGRERYRQVRLRSRKEIDVSAVKWS